LRSIQARQITRSHAGEEAVLGGVELVRPLEVRQRAGVEHGELPAGLQQRDPQSAAADRDVRCQQFVGDRSLNPR
jgi:hypothetical protein